MGITRPRATDAPYTSSVSEGTVVYAIGDIHGRLDLLRRLEEKIHRDAAAVDAERRLIICLGDYVDRGDDSFGVIEHLLQPPPEPFERVCLIGNHEAYMLRFFDDSSVAAAWLDNGGDEALLSYDVTPLNWSDLDRGLPKLQAEFRANLPASHENFLRSLKRSHREGDYLFVHAGVRPGVPLDQQDPEDLIWIRQEFLTDQRDFGAIVVHGHSIRPEPENLPNRIGIDTGAFRTGQLTCAVLWQNERRFLST